MTLFSKLITAVIINTTAYVAREKVIPVVTKKIKNKVQQLKNDLEKEEEDKENFTEKVKTEKSKKEVFVPKWNKET